MNVIQKTSHFVLCLLSSLLLLTACAQSGTKTTETNSAETALAAADPTPAEETFVSDLEWQAFYEARIYNMYIEADLPKTNISHAKFGERLLPTFEYESGEVEMNVRLINNGEPMQAGFIVLCDGIPMEFTIPGSPDKMTHLSCYLEKSKTLKIFFTPSFASGLGRVDVIAFGKEDINAYGFNRNVQANFMALLPDDYQPSPSPNMPMQTLAYVALIREPFKPHPLQKNEYSFDAHIIDVTEFAPDNHIAAYGGESLSEADEFLFELAANPPGRYRITAMLDFAPFPLFNGDAVIDCVIGAEEMLSFTAPVGNLFPEGAHSFFVIVLPLDEPANTEWWPFLTSRREIIR